MRSMGIYYLTCNIDAQKYAASLNHLKVVVNTASLLPSVKKSPHLLGLLNDHGTLTPLKDGRGMLGPPLKKLKPADQWILKLSKKSFGLCVDQVGEVIVIAQEQITCVGSNRYFKDTTAAENIGTLILDLEKGTLNA